MLTPPTTTPIHQRQYNGSPRTPPPERKLQSSLPEPVEYETGMDYIGENTNIDFHLPSQTPHQQHVTTRELDKVARNIHTFIPNHTGGHAIHTYLQDIDFHLQRSDSIRLSLLDLDNLKL